MLTLAAILFVFSLVVVIHEWGHYYVCRLMGVRVERFAIGFGKEIFGFEWKGTRWSFCILPLGGYVKPAGEDMDESNGAPDEFFGQNWYRRIAIALAGPVMNYVLAFLCFFFLAFYWGRPQPSQEPVIGEVVSGYPAQAAGLEKNDRILAIDGRQVQTWSETAEIIHASPEKTMDILYRRKTDQGEIEKRAAIIPKKDPQRQIGVIGIAPSMEMNPQGLGESLLGAAQQTYFWTALTLKYLGDAIVKRKKPELAGPIGIVSIVAKVAHEGFQELVGLIALISLSLGLFNFFPVPLLDGGHVFLYLLEGILGKPLNKAIIRVANIVGATVLIAVFLFATTQDISRLQNGLFK
ncbi:MAG: site-2 protease family protein [Elusimicrobia bacterium]|nr:site-2 protease family protein [Elusimicrobiota bacterium]